jgi:amidophosphoribosyltransferase
MVWGKMEDGTVVVASESCALDTLGVVDRQEIPAAGIVKVNAEGIRIIQNDPLLYRESARPKHCIFEHVYYSRPDSHHFGEDVYKVREKIGAALAKADAGMKADYVVPIPDSSNFIGFGYSNHSGIPLSLGLIRNHYVGRSFTQTKQAIRDESVRRKYNLLPHFFEGKSIVLIDDSIVRGTTIRKIVDLIKPSGVREVHLRIGSPEVRHGCYYGIDTPSPDELFINKYSVDEICEKTGVDSLKYLQIEDMLGCVSERDDYCLACFNGDYPVKNNGEFV